MSQPELYYVHYAGFDDFNCDLFVNAETPEQAYDLWLDYCHANEWHVDKNSNVTVWEINSIGSTAGVADWSEITSFAFKA